MKGKRILITGGAGGLGAVACWAFAAQGARVIALDHGTDIEARLDTGRTAFEAGAGVELDVGPGTVDSLHADLADTHALNETIHADMRRNGGFDVLISLLVLQDNRTLMVGIAALRGEYTTNVPLLCAGLVLAAAPIVVLYVLFQRRIVSGIAVGAVKG